MTLEDAGKELCRLIFDKKSRRWLSQVTSESLLGVSAVSITWKNWFNRAFFAAGLDQGPPLLEEIVTRFKDDYLPSWFVCFPYPIDRNDAESICLSGHWYWHSRSLPGSTLAPSRILAPLALKILHSCLISWL